jgi:hypothetical protein
MSSLDPHGGRSSGLTFAGGAPDVRWIRPDMPGLGASTSKPAATQRGERANAAIVIALTLGCTALAIFDLLLLASGS